MKKLQYKKGFSLIDLLVSMSIATLLMSVVLFSYRTFHNKLAVSVASQDIALASRQTQTYSVNAKETSPGSNNFYSGYGVYFNTQIPGAYYIFADKNNDGKYSGDANCSLGSECIQKNVIKNNAAISNLCGISTSGIQTCFPSGGSVSVVYPPSNFQSSIADATISFSDTNGNVIPGTFSAAKIVSSINDTLTQTVQSSVTIYTSGQTYVQSSIPSIPTSNHPPVLALVGTTPMRIRTGSTFVDPGATASDQEDGNLTSQITKSGSVNSLVSGTYSLTYNVKDSQGFSAQTLSRTVVVGSCTAILSGSVDLAGKLLDINTSGSYAYGLVAYAGFNIYNISNPSTPIPVAYVQASQYPTGVWVNYPTGMYVNGSYVYITTSGATIAGSGTHAYVTYSSSVGASFGPHTDPSLLVFDVSNPSHPVNVSVVSLSTLIDPVSLAGGNDALLSFDLTNASHPIKDGVVNTVANSGQIYISGSYAYVIYPSDQKISIYNIAQSSSMVLVGSINTSGTYPYKFAVKGNYAYITSGLSPIAISGTYAYVTYFSGINSTLQVFNISDPSHTVMVANVPIKNDPTIANTSTSLIEMFDISDPTNPTYIGATKHSYIPSVISIQNGTALIGNSTSKGFNTWSLDAYNLTCY